MQISDIKNIHRTRFDELTRKRNENALLTRQIDENIERLLQCVGKLDIAKKALDFLYEIANSRRGVMKRKIEDVVSEALRLIYGADYRVEMTYSVKNNRSHLAISMVRDTKQGEVRRENNGFGGGLSDTISVPIRLMVLLGARQASRICVLDECYKHMDGERIERVAQFLRTLSERLKMQIIICTHHDVLRVSADKAFLISEVGGRSMVRTV